MKFEGILILLVASQALAVPAVFTTTRQNIKIKDVRSPQIDLCKPCISLSGQFINQLLNIVLNAGVVGGCGEICNLLAEKVDNQYVGVVCELLCDYVGIKEFVKAIESADLDPIYYCELLKACPIVDDGDATIRSFAVIPKSVAQGREIHFNLTFETTHGTGTGEIVLDIDTQDGIPVGDSELSEPLDPGMYALQWSVKAAPDPNCDPTQDFCEQWLPGNYTAHVAICNGECGSKHPHSQVYDVGSAPFTVTG